MHNRTLGEIKSKYYNNACFHQIVNLLYTAMINLELSPDELRDASYLAIIKFMTEYEGSLSSRMSMDELFINDKNLLGDICNKSTKI